MPKTKTTAIHYTLTPVDPAAHLFSIMLTIAHPAMNGQQLALPAWIPGSYMIRDFARNIVQIHASCHDKPIPLTKQDKHAWQAAPCSGPLLIHYSVYAWDLSVRAAHLDQTHGFFNGTSVFLRVIGQEEVPHIIDIQPPQHIGHHRYNHWKIATTLPEYQAKRGEFGTYRADNYDTLVDHPVEMGTFQLGHFTAHGIPHEIVITGHVPNLNMLRLCQDLQTLCQAHITLFDPIHHHAPMKRYVFLVTALTEGYGGLEHRSSAAIICRRNSLPVHHKTCSQTEVTKEYQEFLGLCSHEYFHTWHIKRMKPDAFVTYDFQKENYTSLLWMFEGFTSYYDDLLLHRCGLINQSAYFQCITQTIDKVTAGTGRHKQSVADSSWDAWIKYYRQDENAPNTIVSYYTKGALIALALDLTLRSETKGKVSLDDVMRTLWCKFGQGSGITEAQLDTCITSISGITLAPFFNQYVHGTKDLPLEKLFDSFNLDLHNTVSDSMPSTPSLGIKTTTSGTLCRVLQVYEGGSAHYAGISAGDVLVAMDRLRISHGNGTTLETLLHRYQADDIVTIHIFRQDELHAFDVQLMANTIPQWTLSLKTTPKENGIITQLREKWLNGAKNDKLREDSLKSKKK